MLADEDAIEAGKANAVKLESGLPPPVFQHARHRSVNPAAAEKLAAAGMAGEQLKSAVKRTGSVGSPAAIFARISSAAPKRGVSAR